MESAGLAHRGPEKSPSHLDNRKWSDDGCLPPSDRGTFVHKKEESAGLVPRAPEKSPSHLDPQEFREQRAQWADSGGLMPLDREDLDVALQTFVRKLDKGLYPVQKLLCIRKRIQAVLSLGEITQEEADKYLSPLTLHVELFLYRTELTARIVGVRKSGELEAMKESFFS